MNTKSLLLIPVLLLSISMHSQTLTSDSQQFTRQDTLRGSITPERAWWDLNYYHLDRLNPFSTCSFNFAISSLLPSNSIVSRGAPGPAQCSSIAFNAFASRLSFKLSTISVVVKVEKGVFVNFSIYFFHTRVAFSSLWIPFGSWEIDLDCLWNARLNSMFLRQSL